ncbi:MAG: hypothetical protein M0Z25_06035 [Nitrospiraceae bacterium]|nr:hypothetical protein [Nitrospiraceae bacterium]
MSGKKIALLFVLAFGGWLAWSLTAPRAWGLEGRLVPVFSRSFSEGRITLASGGGLLFLLSEKAGTVSRVDPGTWTLAVRIAGLKNPRDLAVSRSGGRLLVDLESSRSLLVLPSTAAGPPLQRTVGLNPGQILAGSDNHYYLVARAVHLLYALDPDRYRPRDWIAVGDVFRRVTPDGVGHLWLPLFRSDGVMEVGTRPFAVLQTIDLDGCSGPVSVLPLPAGGFLAGCQDAIVSSNGQGAVRRVPLRGAVSHGVRELLLFPGGREALAIFHRSRTMVLFDVGSLKEISRYRLPYRPARLYIFPNWPILFVVMNDQDHEMTRLSGYRLPDFPGQSDTIPVTNNSGKKK